MSPDSWFDYLCFDLDGTIIDSADGILSGLCEALAFCGRHDISREELLPQVGITLREIFAQYLPPAKVEPALHYYRQRYKEQHLTNATPYPGIQDLLSSLHARAIPLLVVTAKLETFAHEVIAHFGLKPFFHAVHGVDQEGLLDDKGLLLAHVLKTHKLDGRRGIMVGDRAKDIIAGRSNGMFTIGVSYGYGTIDELHSAAADLICSSLSHLAATLLDNPRDLPAQREPLRAGTPRSFPER